MSTAAADIVTPKLGKIKGPAAMKLPAFVLHQKN